MKILYISPSVLPSRSANSIHVMRMCEAFASLGHEVTLLAYRSVRESGARLLTTLERCYGVSLPNLRIRAPRRYVSKALNVRLGLWVFAAALTGRGWLRSFDLVISRNLYASYLLGVALKRHILVETHQIESSFRGGLQRAIALAPGITHVVISRALAREFAVYHGIVGFSPIVLHDAAPTGNRPLHREEKLAARIELLPDNLRSGYTMAVGYFGHLYAGRGIEVIAALAERFPQIKFFVFGGNETQIREVRARNAQSNLVVMGYLEPAEVPKAMAMMDALLMPYQRKVSVGTPHSNTADYMSPMKMFEYMSVGLPIIASRLPVLEEVLQDGENCLLANPDDPDDWARRLSAIMSDKNLADRLASKAHKDYVKNHTWTARAGKMICAVQNARPEHER